MLPFPLFYLWKFVVIKIVFRIHLCHLSLCWGSEHFDDLNEVIKATLTYEKRASIQHFEQDASKRPDIDHCSVVISSEYQLRSSVASRANVGQIGFIGQDLSRSKITNDQSSIPHKQVMRLDVPMANAERMYIKQSSKSLISIQLHLKGRKCLAIGSDVTVKIAFVVLHDDV